MVLAELNHWQQLAFCTALCERSMPNFQLFCEMEDCIDDFTKSRKILNKVWEYLRGQLTSLKNMENQLEVMNEIIPDPEKFEHFGAYPAMDVMVNLQSCLQSVLDSSILDAHNIHAMTQARLEEVLEMQEIDVKDSELWLRQQDFENQVIDLICQQKSHADIVKALIPMSKDHGVSQLGICLED